MVLACFRWSSVQTSGLSSILKLALTFPGFSDMNLAPVDFFLENSTQTRLELI